MPGSKQIKMKRTEKTKKNNVLKVQRNLNECYSRKIKESKRYMFQDKYMWESSSGIPSEDLYGN